MSPNVCGTSQEAALLSTQWKQLPTAAELQAQADWDESNLQVQGIFGFCISQMLCPHFGTNAAGTWANLQAQFGTPGVSKIAADM